MTAPVKLPSGKRMPPAMGHALTRLAFLVLALLVVVYLIAVLGER
jgi:hypothetical protein